MTLPSPRQLYARLLHRETGRDGLAMARAFLAAAGAADVDEPQRPELETPQALATALRWYAPAALLQWDWLRGVGHCAHGHRPANALLLRAYLDAAGLDQPTLALAAQYRTLANAAGVHLPAAAQLAAPEPAFLEPCAVLSLACRPAERFGQILGYTQAHCRLSAAWLDWLERQLQRHGLACGYVERHRQLLERHGAIAGDADAQDLAAGWALCRYVHHASAAALCRELAITPAQQAERLLQHTAPYAIGHHGRVLLQGQSLDRWLAAGDWPGLRQALAQSRYLAAEDKSDAPLFQTLEFGGAMFGVFNDEEKQLLRLWLQQSALDSENPPLPPFCKGGSEHLSAHDSPHTVHDAPAKLPIRELYHQLLNRETHPDSLPQAMRHAERILAWTRLAAPLQTGLRRAFPYSPAAFRQRLDAIHHGEMARYRPPQGPPKLAKDIYLWGIVQMAPAILLDGCWLENAAGAEPAADEVRRRLLRTFADEVGAGRSEWNHPNVYRRLLESLHIALPPVDSREFAEQSCFSGAAFVLPAYLLAIGLWPERYFPELLGLNLAIELNGLGATYMHLVDALRYHGIDPTIVSLHLSIDNLASGHAALAREAIECYLEQIQTLGGPSALAPAWRRVWTGYQSLAAAGLPFAWAGVKRYGQWKLAESMAHLCQGHRLAQTRKYHD